MANFQIPQILLNFENERKEGKDNIFENEESEDEEDNEIDSLHKTTPSKTNKILMNIKKYSRPRAKSIDVGRIIFSSPPPVVHEDREYLNIDEEDLANRLKKKKLKNKIVNKFQSLIRKGSGPNSGTTSPTPYKGRNRAYSIDFSNTTRTDLAHLSPILAQAMNNSEDSKPNMSRRSSLAGPPEGTFQHNVGPDETLASIAAKHRSTIGELKFLNRLMNDMVFPEQVLHIPEEPLSVSRRRIKSESTTSSEDYFRSDSPSRLGKVTEENHHLDSDDDDCVEEGDVGEMVDNGDKRGGRVSGKARDSVINDTVNNCYSYDNIETNKKKSKNHIKNVDKNNNAKKYNIKSTTIIKQNFQKLGRPKPKSNVFSATLNYITGAEDVSGLLAITVTDVRFDPFKKKDPLNASGKESLNAIYDLIKHRMSLANLLHDASITDDCSFRSTKSEIFAEKNTHESKDGALSSKNFKYLCLKLKKKKSKISTQTPFLEALIKNVLPGPKFYEHYFTIPCEIIHEFEIFMNYYYHDNYNIDGDEEIDLSPTLPNVHDIQTKRETFRRTLSVAELCNLALPEMSEESQVFTDGHTRVFREFLPPKVDGRPWQLGYSSWKHGFSINTMYRSLEKQGSDSVALMIIEDTSHQVFGSLICGGGVKRSEGFYGTGESFLFTFYNFFQKFSWTSDNNCIAKGSHDMFAVGASDSKFGLYLDSDLEKGFSYACKTFNNEPLTNDTAFRIHTIEVWLFPMELNS